ncbi:MAG: phosphate acyltransferase [Anaeromyxobacter sp.]
MGPIPSLERLVEAARAAGPRRLVVAAAESDTALAAAGEARRRGLAEVVLVGAPRALRERLERLGEDPSQFTLEPAGDDLEAARRAVALVRAGEGAVILKGRIATADLLRAVLHRTEGLRTDRLLSDVLVADHPLAQAPRLVGVTDGGVNVAPGLEQKQQIIENAAAVFRALGVARPRVGCLCAAEVGSDAMPHTRDAEALARAAAAGELGACEVSGPLALDNLVSAEAARAKGIADPVAGQADVILAPSIEAGNALGKAFTYLARRPVAHVIAGARAPVLIPSRVESAADKLCSIALGVLVAGSAP